MLSRSFHDARRHSPVRTLSRRKDDCRCCGGISRAAPTGLSEVFRERCRGIGALLQIIGTLYSVVYAFAIYVIWGQFTSVENEIQKESGALKDLLLFGQRLKETVREPIVRAVKVYARGVAETEWRTLSAREETDKTDKLFSAVISTVTEVTPEDDIERIVYQRLLEIANQASAHRDERLPSARSECRRHFCCLSLLRHL